MKHHLLSTLIAILSMADATGQDSANPSKKIFKNSMFWSAPIIDTIDISDKQTFLEFLKSLPIKSSNVFMSGANFSSTFSASVLGSVWGLKDHFDKCVTGSKISFERLILIKPDGSPTALLYKAIVFR